MVKRKIGSMFFLLFLLGNSLAYSATVTQTKGAKVLISLEGDSVSVDEEFYLVNPATGKRAAIIKIIQTKNDKAVGEVIKGKGNTGYTLEARVSASSLTPTTTTSTENYEPPGHLRMLKDSYGLSVGYILDSMDADVTYKDSYGITRKTAASMTGNGFALNGFYDYAFVSDFIAHIVAGVEQFNVAGTAADAGCTLSTQCDAKINYLSTYALLKWYPLQGKYRGWIGAGAGYMFALSKSSTALNESQISTNQVYTAAVGSDIQMDRNNYLPLSLEYNLFPPSATVKANMIIVKIGWAWNI